MIGKLFKMLLELLSVSDGFNNGSQAKTSFDLSRAPYVLYGVKYIDLVSLW